MCARHTDRRHTARWGNYVTAGWRNSVTGRWGNYVTELPLTWGNYLTADNQEQTGDNAVVA